VADLRRGGGQPGVGHALPVIERIRAVNGVDADAVLARRRWKQHRLEEATAALEPAFLSSCYSWRPAPTGPFSSQ